MTNVTLAAVPGTPERGARRRPGRPVNRPHEDPSVAVQGLSRQGPTGPRTVRRHPSAQGPPKVRYLTLPHAARLPSCWLGPHCTDQ
ncbi:hypothetical protein GCM10009738_59230 [Kitasatospora viridis]